MIRGTPGLRPALEDVQMCWPGRLCDRCDGELYPGETAYLWEEQTICSDCFQAEIRAWLQVAAIEVAAALGVEAREVTG